MICFDTMVLIWGIQEKAAPGQTSMVQRTKRYIASLSADNEQIMIPTPALGEYLQAFETEERKQQLKALERNFFIPSFNLPAAFLAAGLAHRAGNLPQPEGLSRHGLKTDIQIISTAIVNGASKIITSDDHFEKLAEISSGRIEVSDVPEIHEQQDLDL